MYRYIDIKLANHRSTCSHPDRGVRSSIRSPSADARPRTPTQTLPQSTRASHTSHSSPFSSRKMCLKLQKINITIRHFIFRSLKLKSGLVHMYARLRATGTVYLNLSRVQYSCNAQLSEELRRLMAPERGDYEYGFIL